MSRHEGKNIRERYVWAICDFFFKKTFTEQSQLTFASRKCLVLQAAWLAWTRAERLQCNFMVTRYGGHTQKKSNAISYPADPPDDFNDCVKRTTLCIELTKQRWHAAKRKKLVSRMCQLAWKLTSHCSHRWTLTSEGGVPTIGDRKKRAARWRFALEARHTFKA